MKKITFIIVCMSALLAKAQEQQIARNNDIWFLQISKIEFKNRLGLENELHYRLADWGGEKQQAIIRPSIFYKANDNLILQVGYSHVQTYPYGEQPVAIAIPENNYWVQAVLNHKVSDVSVSHRYRLEERWVGQVVINNGDSKIDGALHRNRFRYRITAKKSLGTTKSYLAAFNEVWVNFGENTGLNRFDQNWLYAGFGHKLSDHLALEAGYMWQVIEKVDGIHAEHNNTIQFTAHYLIKNTTK